MYENVAFVSDVCCVGPQLGTFCSVNTSSSPVTMQVKTELGVLVRSYAFYPSNILSSSPYTQNSLEDTGFFPPEVVGLKYVGPLNTSSYYDGAIFYTLERRSNKIRTYYTYTKASVYDIDFKHTASDVNFSLSEDLNVNANSLKAKMSIYNASKLSQGSYLILGPSSKDGFVGRTEKVIIDSFTIESIPNDNNNKIVTILIKSNWNVNLPEYAYSIGDSVSVEGPLEQSTKVEYSSNIIRKWKLDATNLRLDLVQTIIKNSDDSNWFGGASFSVEHYVTTLAASVATGSGEIRLTSNVTLNKYDKLLLGPSTDVDNLGAFEEVSVDSVEGSIVRIRTDSGYTPPKYDYVVDNSVTIFKNIHLLCDAEPDIVDEIEVGKKEPVGYLYSLDELNYGAVLNKLNSGLFNNVKAADWCLTYGALGIVKELNVVYYSLTNNEIIRSQYLSNYYITNDFIVPILALSFSGTTVYKFQRYRIQRDDTGVYVLISWSTCNLNTDSLLPYTASVTSYVNNCIILPGETNYLTVIVRDQFGVGLLNKNVWVSKGSEIGDVGSSLDPLDGYLITDANGLGVIRYKSGYSYSGIVNLYFKADGSNSTYGSAYIVHKKFFVQLNNITSSENVFTITDVNAVVQTSTLSSYDGSVIVKPVLSLMYPDNRLSDENKWQDYPGSEPLPEILPTSVLRTIWTAYFHKTDSEFYAPEIKLALPLTKLIFSSFGDNLGINDESIIDSANMLGRVKHCLALKEEPYSKRQVSINYVSRHINYGNTANVNINQFVFVSEAVPAMWSEKNNVDTKFWIRLRPFATDLNPNTLVIKLREISYEGDSGWYDITSLGTITTFDAGTGLEGVDFLYYPLVAFKHNATVYVNIEVYDTSGVPNLLVVNYWFKLIQDYQAPYITNRVPDFEELDVSLDTPITFDLLDVGAGVDINTLQIFINNVSTHFEYLEFVPGNFHIKCLGVNTFHYGEKVRITVDVKDRSENKNRLYDSWYFYCLESSGPWIDKYNVVPLKCAVDIKKGQSVEIQVYAIDNTGLDQQSIKLDIGGKTRSIILTPIIYREY